MTSDALSVFVSSTSEDLKDHRAVTRNLILDMGWQPVMMEHMGASPKRTVDACLDLVGDCNLVVLLIAFRQGWVPSGEQGGDGRGSITFFELEHARSKNIPVLAFLADDDWPGKLWEEEQQARDWIKQFRANLNLPAEFFGFEEDPQRPAFKAKLHAQLVKHREEMTKRAVPIVDASSSMEHFSRARDGMLNGNNIPFIGPLIYGDGPLSPGALARALAPELEQDNPVLAIAAEHREAQERDRAIFLKYLTDSIKEQSEKAHPYGIHDLIASKMKKPWFVVYSGLDRKLEEHLEAKQVSYAVVTHVARSYDAKHDGKILVIRNGAEPQLCLAHEVELDDGENVIYRPLGSPLLHEGLDEEWGLDTVVITESDHLTFLRRNEHEDTQIPTRFVKQLNRRPLLFLGYPMDLWHLRLVMKVFQSNGRNNRNYRRAATFAVRKSASPLESLAWRRLQANLIPLELEEFVDRINSDAEPPPPDEN